MHYNYNYYNNYYYSTTTTTTTTLWLSVLLSRPYVLDVAVYVNAQNPLHTFPLNFPV